MTIAPRAQTGVTMPPPNSASPTLLDLMYKGFYALFMVRSGNGPRANADIAQNMTQFLDEFVSSARKIGAVPDDIDAARYAMCATFDESMLRSTFAIREEWARRPLQLALFGDQLAGENFFTRLEAMRLRGSAHLQALEVFHMCLLLGFQGRYYIEGVEKLNYLTARLGDDIANMKGNRCGLAPHSERPDHILHKLRSDLPLWVMASVFALICLLGYLGLRTSLDKTSEEAMARHTDVISVAPKMAHLTITLP